MLCLNCGASMETHCENYHYTASGLPHVTLQQVEVSRCPNCGETEVAIPHIEALHRAIATALVVKRARLAPEEIRFLRKYLGWSGVDFAAYMGVAPETVSRWEQGKTPMGGQADRLLRVLVMQLAPGQACSAECLTALLRAIAEETDIQVLRLGFTVTEADWHATALSAA